MKPVYLLSMFYSSAKEHAKELKEVNTTVREVSGGDFHVLCFGTGASMIGFTSDLPASQLSARLSGLGGETFSYLLVEASALLQGTTTQQSMEWILRRLPPARK